MSSACKMGTVTLPTLQTKKPKAKSCPETCLREPSIQTRDLNVVALAPLHVLLSAVQHSLSSQRLAASLIGAGEWCWRERDCLMDASQPIS